MQKLDTLREFIESENTLALSTVGEDGLPRVAALFYLPGPDMQLFWFSSSTSEHSLSLKRCPEVAVSIHHATADWKKIRGAQLRGVARAVSDSKERAAVSKVYAKRFRLGRLLQAAMAASELFVFEPRWARYTDNSKGFGGGFELALPAE